MITISKEQLGLGEYQRILFDKDSITISENTLKEVEKCFLFLKEFSVNKVIYGVNTGLGPMAQYRIENEELRKPSIQPDQKSCCGQRKTTSTFVCQSRHDLPVKEPFTWLFRHPSDAVQLLTTLINKDIIPYIPEHGGVGASGDLVQLVPYGIGSYW